MTFPLGALAALINGGFWKFVW